MIFNFKFFFLKTYLTKLTSDEQRNSVQSKECRDWQNLESDCYFPKSQFLESIYLGLIRHKNFNERLINLKVYE